MTLFSAAAHSSVVGLLVFTTLSALSADSPAATEAQGTPQGIVVHGDTEAAQDAKVDEQIAQEISKRLEADRLVPSYKVEVSSADKVVTLRGIVETLMARERALQVAQVHPGIKAVRNEITVAAPQRDDGEIQLEVQRALRADPALKGSQLAAVSRDRHVTLTGTVNSQHRKLLAGMLAKGVRGVVSVENEIKFMPQPFRSDVDLAADVLSRIKWDPWLNSPRLGVTADQGVVKVTGQVKSHSAKQRVHEDAMAPGVKSVDLSHLQVMDEVAGVEGPLEKLSPTGRLEKEAE